MKKYDIDQIRGCGLYKLMEQRTVKGKRVWVCIGILTGRGNSGKLLVRLNGRR
jgi:hypothetical protein